MCGYPEWTISKVKKDRSRPKPNPATSKISTKNEKSKGLAVIPYYVEGLSEGIVRVFRKHCISTAMKPHRSLHSMLVHSKDKLLPHQKSEAIYEILCADCPKSYIVETGRSFGTRLQEHQKEVEKFELKPHTQSSHKSSVAEQHKSTITDHVVLTNHNIKWDAAKVIDSESHKTTRWVKEAIWIRRKGKNTLNKDEGHTNWAAYLINLSTPRPQRQLLAATKGRSSVDKVASLKKLCVW